MDNPYYDLTKPEKQVEIIKGWFDEDDESGETYFFKQVIFNLNLLRFYQRKFGKVSLEEFAKFMEESE